MWEILMHPKTVEVLKPKAVGFVLTVIIVLASEAFIINHCLRPFH